MATGDDAVNCSNSANMTLDQLLKAAVTKDATGKRALRVAYVDACENDGASCDESHLSGEDLLRRCFTVNECGKVALRLAPPAAYL
jgi:precorrin-4 methylase